MLKKNNNQGLEIAIIGMAGRFPGARNIFEFQANLQAGVESVRFFSDQELQEAGIKEEWLQDPSYVKSSGCPLEDADCFDNSFFGYTAREAALMDPQLRLFHEVVWEALENAAYVPGNDPGLIGLYAGSGFGFSWQALSVLSGKSGDIDPISLDQLINKDYLCARVSYKLNLKGPVVSLQTTCSTSLVAVHFACRALLTGECDLAIAGGVRVLVQPNQGYFYHEGMVSSPDGHCRAFDAAAGGTTSGSGVGVVILKRRKQAEEDGDHIWAVILGSAINNDGSRKIGFSAPSPEAQSDVIRTVLKITRVEPESIGYIETHGTGTALGDPVEIAALKKAFAVENKGFCALGSVKTAVGHLDAAAGVTGLIKTALALKYRLIPPSLHFQVPNPAIDFINSPFYINTQAVAWENNQDTENNIIYPRRAGVSAFGMGGTNAHLILEETPHAPSASASRDDAAGKYPGWKILLLSAQTPAVLEQMSLNLGAYLENNPAVSLADVAYTLQTGRNAFPYRRMLVTKEISQAISILTAPDSAGGKLKTALAKKDKRPVAFIFPGLGSQYVDMGAHLYHHEPLFRREIDRCFSFVKNLFDQDIKNLLYPLELLELKTDREKTGGFPESQLLIFIFEYALAQLLIAWGIQPQAMIGYSLGEYTAACIAGVFSLEDALKILAVRGELISQTAGGGMLSIPCRREQLEQIMANIPGNNLLSIAIDNGASCVAAGPARQIAILQEEIKSRHMVSMRLQTGHALHSPLMKPVLNSFTEAFKKIVLNPPAIPYISNLTGDWIENNQAASAHYWPRHMAETVRFADGLNRLLAQEDLVIIEVGPGNMLANLVKSHPCLKPGQTVIPLIPNLQACTNETEDYFFHVQAGRLWMSGVDIQWPSYYVGRQEKRHRLPLPSYPFERRHFPVSFNFQPDLEKLKTLWPGINVDEIEIHDKKSNEKTKAAAIDQQPDVGEIFQQRPDLNTPYVPPGDETEQTLAFIFQDFFGLEKVGIEDDFFQLGGDSLKAMNVVSKIYKVLGVEIPLKEFFQGRTIKAISAYIRQDGIKSAQYIEIEPAEEKEYYPLSSVQKRLFFLQQMEPGSSAYNISLVAHMEGEISKSQLELIFNQLIQRHESLRTSFEVVGEEPVQSIHRHVPFAVRDYELIEKENNNHLEAIIKDFIRPFDLARAPLLRVGLIKKEANWHILMVDLHHLISDGVSHGILQGEFMRLYRKETLNILRLQYRDFSEWQHSSVYKKINLQQEEYWLNQYQEDIPVMDLPIDIPRSKIRGFAGDIMEFKLSPQQTRQLNTLVSRLSSTLFLVLLGIYNVLLSKLTGNEDIVIGTPVACRRHENLGQIVGMFVNTLALRHFPQGHKTLNGFLAEVKDRTLEAFENQEYPFEKLVETILAGTDRDPGRNPVFDSMFDLKNLEVQSTEVTVGGKFPLTIRPLMVDKKVSMFDLSLSCIENEGQLVCWFEYSTVLFKKETIARLARYFQQLIYTIVEPRDNDINLYQIEIITEEERKQILYDFNNIEIVFSQAKTLHGWFEEQVERTPDYIALHGCMIAWMHDCMDAWMDGDGGEGKKRRREEEKKSCVETLRTTSLQITYFELNKQSDYLAGLLIEKGVLPDTIVGIMMERSIEMIIGIMGILKSGGAYLPIDPKYPQERIDYMLKDCAPKILITNDEKKKDNCQYSIVNCQLSMGEYRAPLQHSAFDLLRIQHSNLAYVIYTSGSTGKPKGVMIEHRNVVHYLDAFHRLCPIDHKDIIIQLAPYTFDLFVEEVFSILLKGGKIFIPGRSGLVDIDLLLPAIVKHGVTILDTTPLLLNELNKHGVLLKDVRIFISGGDVLKKEYIDNLPKGLIYNTYGPTEGTICCTFYQYNGSESYGSNISIGKPIIGYNIFILNQSLCLQPVGIGGELYVSGPGVSRGYLNNPGLTAEKFDQDLWDKKDGQDENGALRANFQHSAFELPRIQHSKYYHTGDLGRWQADGNIEFLGRIDHQVKIRGFRIEIGEIENCLLQYQGVKTAVVVIRKSQDGKYPELCAYIVGSRPLKISLLRAYLSQKLPYYMVPAYFIQLDRLPLTTNNKVNLKALPTPVLKTSAEYQAPVDSTGIKLAQSWSQVLGVKSIGINDNFFELGGDSIKAIQVASRLRKQGLRMEIRDLLSNPTIKKLTPYIKPLDFLQDRLNQQAVNGRVPLTPIQEWFFENYRHRPHHFNQAVMLYRDRGFDGRIVNHLFQKIIDHHDALRMIYILAGDQVFQDNREIEGNIFQLEVINLYNEDVINLESTIEKEANRIQSSIHLETGPLVRLALFKTHQGDHLLIIIHHLVMDGISWRILLEDFALGYRQALDGETIRFQAKTNSFRDWSYRVREYAESPVLLNQLNYWKYIEKSKIQTLPRDFEIPGTIKKIKNRGTVYCRLNSQETTKLLREVYPIYKAEINDILLASLTAAVRQWGKIRDVLINLEGHGREEIIKDIDISRTIGWFTSQFPVLFEPYYSEDDQPDHYDMTDWLLLIQKIKDTLQQVPFKGVGYGILRYSTPRSLKKDSEFKIIPEITFNYLGQFTPTEDNELFQVSGMKTGNDIDPELNDAAVLDINGMILNGELVLSISYNSGEYKSETVGDLAELFQANLQTILRLMPTKTGEPVVKKEIFPPGNNPTPGFGIRKYNKNFYKKKSYPLYYNCFLGCALEKISYEENLQFNRHISLAAEGNILIGYVNNDELNFEYTFLFPYYMFAGMKGFLNQLNISVHLKTFSYLAEQLTYIKKQLQENRLVLVRLSTYFLYYTLDYMQEKQSFLKTLATMPDHTYHTLIVIDMCRDGYLVYDINFDFFGKIRIGDFHNSLKAYAAIGFLTGHPALKENPPYQVLEIHTQDRLSVDNRYLIVEALKQYIGKYTLTDSFPFEFKNKTYYVHIGLKALKELISRLEKLSSSEKTDKKVGEFFDRYYQDLKFALIILKNFLDAALEYIPTLNNLLFFPEKMLERVTHEIEANKDKVTVQQAAGDPLSLLQYIYQTYCEFLHALAEWLEAETKN